MASLENARVLTEEICGYLKKNPQQQVRPQELLHMMDSIVNYSTR